MKLRKYRAALLIMVSTGLAVAVAAPEPDYQLLASENQHYRTFSRSELEALIGSDQKVLPYYQCDGQKEFTLLPEVPVSRSRKDSLRIKAYDSDEVIVYREGKYWTLKGEPIAKLKDKYFKHVQHALERLESLENSRLLLRQMEKSRYPVVITFGSWMMFEPSEFKDARKGVARSMSTALMIFLTGRKTTQADGKFDHIGVGGNVIWNPQMKLTRFESDGVEREVPPYLSLAHELFHAFDGVRGVLDRRTVWNLEKYEQAEVAEYRAVYFENTLRKQLGLNYSKRYGSTNEGADMLDESGEPILIPTPCL